MEYICSYSASVLQIEEQCKQCEQQRFKAKAEHLNIVWDHYLKTHNVSEMVHVESESKDVGVFVVGIDVLSVGQPHQMSLQLPSH